jgi:hypothetical protein
MVWVSFPPCYSTGEPTRPEKQHEGNQEASQNQKGEAGDFPPVLRHQEGQGARTPGRDQDDQEEDFPPVLRHQEGQELPPDPPQVSAGQTWKR